MTTRYLSPLRAGAMCALALFAVLPGLANAQETLPIPIRRVTVLASTDSGVLQIVSMLHPQSDGRVLVNDATGHRLLLFDATLKTFKIVADTAGKAPNSFGTGPGGLLFFPGDSAAWIDRASQALVVVGANGSFGRVTTPPKVADMVYFTGSANGVPGFDVRGRLYYRGVIRPMTAPVVAALHDTLLTSPDVAPIVRADFDARRIDTIAMVHVPVNRQRMHPQDGKPPAYTAILDPVTVTDEWAYFRDGTVAVVRAQDYHIDWFFADGTTRSTPKMPFDWRRLTDADKRQMVDSVGKMIDSVYKIMLDRVAELNKHAPPGASPAYAPPKAEVARLDEIPDYFPAVRASSQVRVDLDDNLWIMPTTSIQAKGGTLYDVVNRKGEIVERVQLPEGRNLHGFGPGGIVYLSVPPQYGWPRIERARIERQKGTPQPVR